MIFFLIITKLFRYLNQPIIENKVKKTLRSLIGHEEPIAGEHFVI